MNLTAMGDLIKKRRELLNLRQEDLAELSKSGIKTIHLVEQGTGNPSFKTIQKVAEVLGLEITLKIKQVN
jgi:transcriptional regulator with XRE-family HTH domain